jgi:hypothetical protein
VSEIQAWYGRGTGDMTGIADRVRWLRQMDDDSRQAGRRPANKTEMAIPTYTNRDGNNRRMGWDGDACHGSAAAMVLYYCNDERGDLHVPATAYQQSSHLTSARPGWMGKRWLAGIILAC